MKGNSMKYIAKKDTWFKEGTECKLIEDYRDYTLPGHEEKNAGFNSGLFEGIFVIDEEKWLTVKQKWNNNKVGDEVYDREVCNFDEFNIIEE
jgi:hypothetical protein